MQNLTDVTDEDIMALCSLTHGQIPSYRPITIIIALIKLGNPDLADRYLDNYCCLEAAEAARSAAPEQIVSWWFPAKTKIVLWQLDMAKDAFKDVCKRIVEIGEKLANSRNIS
ncbi:MAG: hypothetical protein M3178_11480 [Pseudomonadota bacterium]|nr:hypothetical protein [Pseudomonadota bacterium]